MESLGTDALPLLQGNPQLSCTPPEDAPLPTPLAGLASLADSQGGCTPKQMGAASSGATKAQRQSEPLPVPSLNLMSSYQGQKPCWARVLPKTRWGFPPKNPYWAKERWPKRQAQKWGSGSPDIP